MGQLSGTRKAVDTLGVHERSEHLLLGEKALAEVGAAVHRVDRGGDVTFHGLGQLVTVAGGVS